MNFTNDFALQVKSSMLRHEQNDAVHAEGYAEEREAKHRPFSCPHCQMRFTMKQTLSRHLDGICKVLRQAKWKERQQKEQERGMSEQGGEESSQKVIEPIDV